MADIKGTNVAAPIVPYTSDDIYATHEAKYGKGGYRTVQSIEERDSIPKARLEEGMLVYVVNDQSSVHTYQYLRGEWVRNRLGLGIPILNQELINQYALDWSKDSYISIGDKNTDPNASVTQNTYTTTVNGNYIDVLFQAIRALQSEVAKLKNSFNYGIESYTGTQTAMSRAQADLNGEQPDFPDEEPLWAVEEDGLSQLGNDIVLGSGHEFKSPDEEEGDISIITDEDNNYVSYVKFNVPNCYLDFNDENEYFKDIVDCKDSKIYFFITSSSTRITLDLDSYGSEANDDGPKDSPLELNLENINLGDRVSKKGVYNILVIISRKQKLKGNTIVEDDGEIIEEDTGDYYGKNFIWISISDPGADYNIVDGYYDESNPRSLSKSLLELNYRYVPNKIIFNKKDTIISKLKVYSKYQDFSENIIANKPSDEDYKFKAAHITIRSVENAEVLDSVKKQILNNELIYEEASGKLWIKTNGTLRPISGSGSSDNTDEDTMTDEELREKLEELGIIADTNGNLSLNNIGDITFIHQNTGKRFKFAVNERGELESQEVPNINSTFSKQIENSKDLSEEILDNNNKIIRGFIALLNKRNADGIDGVNVDKDLRLDTDRVRIGSFYAPIKNDIVHGCSHSYIELENTSNKDYPLVGCYLHWTGVINNNRVTYHLPLTGTIKAGSTYLIRGRQHAEFEDSNVFIKVKTYDQEWYLDNGELISFEVNEDGDGCGFALTYGLEELNYTQNLWESHTTNNTITGFSDLLSTYPYIINKRLLDSIYYPKIIGTSGYWAKTAVEIRNNTLYRNTFELDPAKQAFQSFNTKDSSRARWANASNDYQVVDLSREYISFPHSEDKYAIANYTPKASWENRNVCTDKTKLDKNKPNMVTTSFGIDIYKTRCFNWISVGYYDEYIWLRRRGNGNTWTSKFNSYLPIIEINIKSITSGQDNTNTIYFDIINKENISKLDIKDYSKLIDTNGEFIGNVTGLTTDDTNSKFSISSSNSSSINIDDIYFIISKNDDYSSSEFPKKKFFSDSDITNNIYARIIGRFPADNSFYTSHKVIVDIVENSVVNDPETWEYIVGRADINGDPDPDHCSDIMTFTLYPESYTPRIYQTTDQQGFHWIEYQVWAAAANEINKKIESDQRSEDIIPILVNTGDMTQNGTRINEWYDYYQAGRHLFDHLEQMNVVGNNDLCGTNINELGTGDDSGKSNSFFFHLFYCYEINSEIFIPLLPNLNNPSASKKYVPSLYYIDTTDYRFLFVNSEITETNCKDWYGLVDSSSTVNAYTGYKISDGSTTINESDYVDGFVTIYTMIYRILQNASTNEKKVIALCHEMPFTVITNSSIVFNDSHEEKKFRSISNTNTLIGSHLNQISKNDGKTSISSVNTNNIDNVIDRGLYWFSRLLEHFKVRLVLGGHKHTYACTYPVRENYYYWNNENKVSSIDNSMLMEETLRNDKVCWFSIDNSNRIVNLSKFPLTRRESLGEPSDNIFFPYTSVPALKNGIIYFMCQASGYKLTSNKELPTANQKFSQIIPETTVKDGKDTASANQKYPMFCIISFNNDDTANLKLIRIKNIMTSKGTFNQTAYSTSAPVFEYMKRSNETDFGVWDSSEENMISSISLVVDN